MSETVLEVCNVCRCPTNGKGAGILVGHLNRTWEAVRCPSCDEREIPSLYPRVTQLPTPEQRNDLAPPPWKPLRESPAARYKAARDVDSARGWVTRAIENGLRYA